MNHDGASQRPTNRLCFLSPPLSGLYVCVRVSSLMFIAVSFSQTHCRCALQSTCFYDAMVHVYNALCDCGQSQFFFPHKIFRAAALQPLCQLTMEGAIVFFPHLPRALILCSGTSYSLCMFACTSAFDRLSGLILAMQSLSQLSNVSLGGTSEGKTPAGKSGLRKELFQDNGWCWFWLCCVLRWAKLTGLKNELTQITQCSTYPHISWNTSNVRLQFS